MILQFVSILLGVGISTQESSYIHCNTTTQCSYDLLICPDRSNCTLTCLQHGNNTNSHSCSLATLTASYARSLSFYCHGNGYIANQMTIRFPNYNLNGNFKDTSVYYECVGSGCRSQVIYGRYLKNIKINCTSGDCEYTKYNFEYICNLEFYFSSFWGIQLQMSNIDIIYCSYKAWYGMCNHTGSSSIILDSTLIVVASNNNNNNNDNNNKIITENDIKSCYKYQNNELLYFNYNPNNITIFDNNTILEIENDCTYLGGDSDTSSNSHVSSNPTVDPTSLYFPTIYPSFYSSIYPTFYPIIYPTSQPSDRIIIVSTNNETVKNDSITNNNTTTDGYNNNNNNNNHYNHTDNHSSNNNDDNTTVSHTTSHTTTDYYGNNNGKTNDGKNNNNGSIISKNINVIILIIVIFIIVLILTMIFLCYLVINKNKQLAKNQIGNHYEIGNEEILDEIIKRQKSKQQAYSVQNIDIQLEYNENDDFDDIFCDLITDNDDNNINGNNHNIPNNEPNFQLSASEELYDIDKTGENAQNQMKHAVINENDNNNNNGKNKIDELQLIIRATSDATAFGETIQSTTAAVDSESDIDDQDNNMLMDETNYHLWTQKQVLLWIKSQLLTNQFDKSQVLSFLKEFSTKYVTGAVLKKFRQNPKFIDAFKMQFTETNQNNNIWTAIKMTVDTVGEQNNTVTKGSHVDDEQ